jgi:peptide-methionine (S)-S-oxide reductase
MEQQTETTGTETAVLGGGCFWCLEAVFTELRGVRHVESGYAGGHTENPSYQQVCSGETGHAEVVRVEFDPEEVTYRELLDVFFTIHDPTTRNRQGADIGTQYRSAVYWTTPGQKVIAEQTIAELQADGVWRNIVTEVAGLDRFWPAEAYHRDYYRRNPDQAYCRAVIAPKVAKLRRHHLQKLRAGR